MDHKKSTGKKQQSLWLNSNFITYINIFMEPSNYDEIPLRKILYFVRGMGLLAE
jgi:hypothetical protein